MSTRRVVVTGLGALTPLANDFPQTWSRLIRGESGIAPITAFDTTGYDCRIQAKCGILTPPQPLKTPKTFAVPIVTPTSRWQPLAKRGKTQVLIQPLSTSTDLAFLLGLESGVSERWKSNTPSSVTAAQKKFPHS